MSAQRDRWHSPAWGFQSKCDARYDLLGTCAYPLSGGGDDGIFGPWVGNVWYVSNSGADTNIGDREHPFLTITKALTKVVAGHNDVIVVLSYYGTSRAAETFPITLTSSHNDCSIVGVMRGNAPRNAIYEPTTAATNAIEITTGNYITLANLNLGGTTTASGLCIGDPDGGAAGTPLWEIRVINCSFGISGAGNYGIYNPIASSQDAPQLLIAGCHFGNGVATAGIRMGFNITRGQILGCDFQVAAGNYGIYIDSTTGMDNICGNTFAIPDDLDGGAIYWENGCTIYNVSGNTATKTGGGSNYSFRYEPWYGPGGTVGVGKNWPDPVEPYLSMIEAVCPEHGKVIFVNGGSDGPTDNNRSGFSPKMCKQTLRAALAMVTANANDCIVVLNYGSNARVVDFASLAITLSSAHNNVRFFGVIGNSTKWPTITVGATAAVHAFELTNCDRVEFYNLELGGAAGKAAIHVSAGGFPWGLVLDNCYFGVDTTVGAHGIEIDTGGDACHLRVRNCTFYGTTAGGALTDDHIEINGNATRGEIKNNLFRVTDDKRGISVEAGGVGLVILDNHFWCNDADGAAIYLSATAALCYCANNMAAVAEDAGITNQIYYDGGSNKWVGNWTSDPTSVATLFEVD